MANRHWSMRRRLALWSAIALLVFLLVGAAVLDSLFRDTAKQAQRDTLETVVYSVLGSIELNDTGQVELPISTAVPKLLQPGSGLYATVTSKGKLLWESDSLIGVELSLQLPSLPVQGIGTWQSSMIEADGIQYQRYAYAAEFESLLKAEQTTAVIVTVAQDLQPYQQLLNRFRRGLILGFLLLVGAFAILLFGLIRRYLSPLDQLADEITAIEKGRSDKLGNHYPLELQPVQRNLNALIAASTVQLEKHRNALADLSHSLKTPLAVLRNRLADDPEAVNETSRMQQIIDHHLNPAAALGNQFSGLAQPLKPAVERVTQSLAKLYPDCEFEVAIADTLETRLDEQDALELLGNLLENACKYGDGKVAIRVNPSQSDSWVIADNGNGIPETQRETLLRRGTRGDSRAPGQGLGLSLARDIVANYGGKLSIGTDEALGGAAIRIEFPGG